MAYEVLPMVVLIGCLLGLVIVVVRKFPHLKSLDVSSIPAERELQLKQQLLLGRLKRRVQELSRYLQRWMGPAVGVAYRWIRRSYQRVIELESESRASAAETVPPPQNLADGIAAARRLLAEGDGRAAEDQLMQIIGRNPAALEAYEALGEVYLELKEYPRVREVYAYVARRLRQRKTTGGATARLALAYFNVATASLQLGRPAQALQSARKAAALEPTNPRLLDLLLKVSIVVRDKPLAEATWEALRQADPQNAKLDELRRQLDQLP